jgi:hypothetical protein
MPAGYDRGMRLKAGKRDKRPSFRSVWAAFQETDRKIRETAQQMQETDRKMRETAQQMQETDRKIAELSKETDRKMRETAQQIAESSKETDRKMREAAQQIAESSKETDRKIAELSKNIGGLNGSLGRLLESMFSAKLWELFTSLGYEFTKGCRDLKFREQKRVIAEVDIFLENGEYAMPVEIKTILSREDVDGHLERIEKIRGYMDAKGDGRRLVGAVAGGSVGEDARRYAHKNGLYVLVQSGDAAALAELPPGFKPKTW